MPLRSPKMYSFIFGFQRFVWWPKCTPASSRSFMAIAVKLPPTCSRRRGRHGRCATPLALAELETLARAGQPVLLPFLDPRVAGQESVLLQRLAQVAVGQHERAGDPEPHRTCLASHAATGHSGDDIELVGVLGDDERGLDLGAQRLGGERIVEGAAVDDDGARTRAEKHAGGGRLATAGAVVFGDCHVTLPRSSSASAPYAGAPDRRTPSTCRTSRRPSSFSGACRARPLRRGGRASAAARSWRALRAGRPHSRCGGDTASALPSRR